MADSTREEDILEIHRLLHGDRPMTQADRADCERALLYMAADPAGVTGADVDELRGDDRRGDR